MQTMPYHPQTNGLVERLHQMIICMIRKLGEDKKANWASHLAEIAHTYNATRSTVTRYSPHYLMFRHRPRLPVNFFFPTISSNEALMREVSTKHVDIYIASIWDILRTALWEAQAQSMAEPCWQKWYCDSKTGAVNLKPCDLVLVKADAFKRKRKIKDRWEEETWNVVHQIVTDIPSYIVMNQNHKSWVLHWNWLLLIASEVGIPLYIGVHNAWDRCTSPTPHKTTSSRDDMKIMSQENNGKAVTQQPTRKASLGWINGKLQLLLWTWYQTTSVYLPDGEYSHPPEEGPLLPLEGWFHTLHLIGKKTKLAKKPELTAGAWGHTPQMKNPWGITQFTGLNRPQKLPLQKAELQ